MVDDARGGKPRWLEVAEPLAAGDALDDGGWGVKVAIGARPRGELGGSRLRGVGGGVGWGDTAAGLAHRWEPEAAQASRRSRRWSSLP